MSRPVAVGWRAGALGLVLALLLIPVRSAGAQLPVGEADDGERDP